MNIVGITGNLTADPDVQHTDNDVAYCRFSVAVRRPRSSEKTDFIRCVAWRNSAELLGKYFHKGDGVGVDGHLEVNSYQDREGNNRSEMVIVADNISFTNGKKEHSENGEYHESRNGGGGKTRPELAPCDDDDDIPF